MRVRSLGLAVLTGVMLSAPMIAVMYLADRWLGLSFPPFDTFDWVARELPGPLVTFGIDTMIGLLMFVGLSVKDFAKTAEQLMAVGGFFTAGVVATAAVYAVVQWRGPDLRRELGLLFGAVAGVPVALMTVNISQSSVNLALVFVWVLALFLAWGFAAVWVARRLVLSTSTVYASEDGDTVGGGLRAASVPNPDGRGDRGGDGGRSRARPDAGHERPEQAGRGADRGGREHARLGLHGRAAQRGRPCQAGPGDPPGVHGSEGPLQGVHPLRAHADR